MSAHSVKNALNAIACSSRTSRELEAELAKVSLRDLYSWTYSETRAVEQALKAAKRRIATQKGAESRSIKGGAR
jgi:hypothetical protein